MSEIELILNRLIVDLFNHILYLEEKNIQDQNIELTMGEIHLLENIENSPEKTVGKVAKLHGVTLGTATVGIDKLVKKGYVVKAKDEKDKRIVRLSLTSPAYHVLAVHAKFHEDMIQSIVKDLDLQSQDELVHSLKNIVEYFHEKYGMLYD